VFQLDVEDTAVKRSDLGRFRTAFLEDGVGPLVICASTCTNYRNVPWTSLGRMAEDDMDVFLHVGDFVYADGSETPEEYRFHYLRALGEENMRSVLTQAGMYVTWDDHEFDNNLNPETMSETHLETAKAAFFENLPARRGEDGELWRSYRWGLTAEFFVLDSRSERLPSTRESDNPIYLSQDQMDWLKQALVDSPCRFKLLLNSVPMVNLVGVAADLLAEDRWQGYQVQRQELLDHINEQNIRDVWFLSGDFHMGFITRLDRTGVGTKLWDVAVGPGANGPNPLPVSVEGNVFEEEEVFPAAMYEYWSSKTKVATTLTLDPTAGTIHIRYVDGTTGDVLYDGTLSQV
ncbi:MAG: alkaline phosphatase D family protein, partial [Myxococcales bacterium]|nr:alkaline phosphatase D family protein [Myxococcales bacterium]